MAGYWKLLTKEENLYDLGWASRGDKMVFPNADSYSLFTEEKEGQKYVVETLPFFTLDYEARQQMLDLLLKRKLICEEKD